MAHKLIARSRDLDSDIKFHSKRKSYLASLVRKLSYNPIQRICKHKYGAICSLEDNRLLDNVCKCHY